MFRNLFRRKPTGDKPATETKPKDAPPPEEIDLPDESVDPEDPEASVDEDEETAEPDDDAGAEPQPAAEVQEASEPVPTAVPVAAVAAVPDAEPDDGVQVVAQVAEPPTGDLPATEPESLPDEPGEKRGFLRRLMDGLSKTRATLTRQVTALLSIGRAIDEDLLEELEEVLIQADVGIATTMHLVQRLREEAAGRQLRDAAELQPLLRSEIEAIFAGGDISVDVGAAKPFVLLVVGVNGVGKTTTIGKLAARWTNEGKKVVIAAGDTFRAAAIEQLEVWAQRAGADLIRQEQGSDAASVVYDAVHAANARKADVLIIDTAGRLHTKKNLMQELEKINRVATREVEGAPHEVLLVLDATTGQNAVEQARQFSQIAPVTGIALTKLDSSAKGGVVIAVRHELDIPVKLIGIGEQIDDLRDFDGAAFVDALLTAEDA
ncbi:signal recognition particle-docking protein FtsY [Candidatus Poribacteria bacterium]|jgi:fused signal recognition particle receptor|nr:signal recognition particle-docking protein FtsY [Candidatus Poribacteria bacterium]MBT5536282.1 signal recognition particle-docking protein FtsY [Candidatus Poribacteria bacterium]MBT5712409.1 signal recognition particle-docking protein FtsY [Candidatus Poribacteria bacterium]MBT7809371.1 signal recognition particle-docking protein FtsY [Candidatus Poribacteria bacterium]